MNYNKEIKLISERFYLTWAGEQMSWTVRMTMKMRDGVDGDLLRQAVESTRQRYPYYQVKLGIRMLKARNISCMKITASHGWSVRERDP